MNIIKPNVVIKHIEILKVLIIIILAIILNGMAHAQTTISMEKVNGIYIMPCKINGLALKFIFDTGASDVSISLTEALFMLKNGYLQKSNLMGTEYYQLANGDIQEGTKIIIDKIEIGDFIIYNIEASIVHQLDAPLLLGQSALSEIGSFNLDYSNNSVTFYRSGNINMTNINNNIPNYNNQNSDKSNIYYNTNNGEYLYITKIYFLVPKPPLRNRPNSDARIIYRITNNVDVYIIERTTSDFYKVRIGKYIGYIATPYLQKVK